MADTTTPKRGSIDVSGGLAALAQGLSALGPAQVPYYTDYLENRNKQLQLQAEATKAQQALAQQQITNAQAQQRNSLYEMNTMNTMGYRPTPPGVMQTPITGPQQGKIDRMNLLRGNTQTGPVTGNIYTPKPDAQAAQVDPGVVERIASYNADIKTIPGFGKSGVRNAYLKAVVAQNPDWDQKNYEAAKKFNVGLGETRRGTPGGIKNSAETLLGHLDLYGSKIDELQNQKVPAQNAIINFAKYNLGHQEITNYQQAQEVVNSELENLLTGVGATQEGLSARRALLSKNASYTQQKEAIKTLTHIISERIRPLSAQYDKYVPSDKGGYLSPYAKGILQKFGADGDTQTFTVGSKTYNIPKDQVEAFKKAKGIK